METLKPLEQLTQMDERNRLFPATLADLHNRVAALELPANVPETLTSMFAVARNLWLYGWFHWPLYTFASSEAYRCIEAALIIRCRREGILPRVKKKNERTPTLKRLLIIAIEHQWLRDADFENFRLHEQLRRQNMELWGDVSPPQEPDRYVKILQSVMPKLRNSFVHPEGQTIQMWEQGLGDLTIARDILQKLFKDSESRLQPETQS